MAHSKPHLHREGKRGFLVIRKIGLHTGTMRTEIWQRLRFARKHGQLTQQQVADACGITREAVSQWEAADIQKRTFPGVTNLQTVSRITGAPLEWLLADGEDLAVEHWLDAPVDTPTLPPPDALTPDELELLGTYRHGNAAERDVIRQQAEQVIGLRRPRGKRKP